MCGMSSGPADTQALLVFMFYNIPSLTSRSLSSSLLDRCLLSVSLPCSSLAFFFLGGAPGDTVLLSSLTDWHGQNESSSSLPKARLCPRGALAACISIRPAVLECTDCDGPWASLAPHRLSRIMQPCPAKTGLVNELDGTGWQLPERRLAAAWWIPAAYLPPSDSAPIRPSWVKSKPINNPWWLVLKEPQFKGNNLPDWLWVFWRCKTATFKCTMSESDWSERTLHSSSLCY